MIALRLVWQLAFFFFLLSAPGLAEAELETRVTLLFIDTPVDEALKAIGKEIGRKVYVARSVEGTVSLEFVNVPAREAFHLVLASQSVVHDIRSVGSSRNLVVATPEILADLCRDPWMPPTDLHLRSIRIECILDVVPSIEVLQVLGSEFPDVEFSPHPIVNGFFAKGSREDLFRLKSRLAELDRPSKASDDSQYSGVY